MRSCSKYLIHACRDVRPLNSGVIVLWSDDEQLLTVFNWLIFTLSLHWLCAFNLYIENDHRAWHLRSSPPSLVVKCDHRMAWWVPRRGRDLDSILASLLMDDWCTSQLKTHHHLTTEASSLASKRKKPFCYARSRHVYLPGRTIPSVQCTNVQPFHIHRECSLVCLSLMRYSSN